MPEPRHASKGRPVLRRRLILIALLAPLVPALIVTAGAQTAAPAPAKKKRSGSISGTPLDTFRQTHIYATVAPAKDFVRESRPDPSGLDYTPLTGTDPEREKPRDAANVAALQAELERDRFVNEGKGRRLGPLKAAKKAAAR